MALMVKEDLEEEGKTLNGVPEMPLGVASPLVREVAKLPLRWLAMVEGAVAILVLLWPNLMLIAGETHSDLANSISFSHKFVALSKMLP